MQKKKKHRKCVTVGGIKVKEAYHHSSLLLVVTKLFIFVTGANNGPVSNGALVASRSSFASAK